MDNYHTRLKFKAYDRVIVSEIDGESVIIDAATGLVHNLNHSAALIWGALKTASTLDELADLIVTEFSLDKAVAQRDADALMRMFVKARLVECIP